jgi:hypothetical protein
MTEHRRGGAASRPRPRPGGGGGGVHRGLLGTAPSAANGGITSRPSDTRRDASSRASKQSRADASSPPAVRADMWCGGREVASKQAQCEERRGTRWWNTLFTPSTCPAGIEPTPSRQTVLQEGTGVCAGAQSLRRPQPLDSRLQTSSPVCHVGLVDAKHSGPPRPGSGPGSSPARADHHDARQGVP